MRSVSIVSIVCITYVLSLLVGCANIVPPGGGPKDSLPPILIQALPKDSSLQFNAKKIQLVFNEFVEVKEAQQQLVVSPFPKNQPQIDYKLRTITILLKDSLQENTTYSLDFGQSVRDINEGNILKNFTYLFSTGNQLDKGTIKGKVTLAETGKYDSTLLVVLHSNLADSAIEKNRPNYIAKVDGKGQFQFKYLPSVPVNVYVVPNDFSKKYDDSTKLFAFHPITITPKQENDTLVPLDLWAYEAYKKKEKPKPAPAKPTPTKAVPSLKYQVNFDNGRQDILKPLELIFSNPLAPIDSQSIVLCDTFYQPIKGYRVQLDTSLLKVSVNYTWKEQQHFKLLINREHIADTAGITINKNDTVAIVTKAESEYGSVKLRFLNLNANNTQPVLQILENGNIIESVVLINNEFKRKLFKPGEYELRILFDTNKNAIWDPGNYAKKLQPEQVKAISQKLSVRANWDNENDYQL